MPERVKELEQVSLNGVRYKLGGDKRVRSSVASQYPLKQVFGDQSKDSNPNTSVLVWNDWSKGAGLNYIDGRGDSIHRFFDSQSQTRYKGVLTPGEAVTVCSGVPASSAPKALGELNSEVYGAFGASDKEVHKYNNGGNTWGSSLFTLPAAAISSLNFTLNGTEYLAFAHTGGYTYTSDGSNYTDDTTDTLYMTFWDDRLWGINNTGQLWFSLTIGTEVTDALLPLPAGYINNMFTGPDKDGDEIIYVATEIGLYAHDAANARFVKTGLVIPQHAQGGLGSCTWNGLIYYAAGMSVYEYDPRRGVIISMGLDQEHGLNAPHRGRIEFLIPTHKGLIAGVTNATYDSVWEYRNDRQTQGWHFVGPERGDDAITSVYASNAYTAYRLYMADDGNSYVSVIPLHAENINYPDADENTSLTFSGSSYHITPWFTAGQNEIDKLAIRLRVDCTNMDANNVVDISFALNYSSSYEASTVTISSDGNTTVSFPTIANDNVEAGSEFRAIRLKLLFRNLQGSNTGSNVRSLSLEWRRKIPAKWRHSFEVDLNGDYKGNSPSQLRAALLSAVESSTMVEFVFRDDDGNDRNFYVDVVQAEGIEETGHSEKGVTRVDVVEL